MAYLIDCRVCGARTKAGNILWLFSKYHTDEQGKIKCKKCRSTEAHIHRKSQLQEEGEYWERWMEAIIRLSDNRKAIYQPYTFLTTGKPAGLVSGIHFGYYKKDRSGKLKHGHGPGGAPVLNKEMLFELLRQLGRFGVISADELDRVAADLRRKDAV